MNKRLPVFIGALAVGIGATWAGGWVFKVVVVAAWLWLVLEVSVETSRALGLSIHRYLWLDLVFCVMGTGAIIFGRLEGMLMCFLAGFFVFFLFYPATRAGLTRWLFSVVVNPYMTIGVMSFLALREWGVWWPLCAIAVVAAADTGAYVVGRKFGKRPMAPTVSPSKTLEGGIGGFILATGIAAIFFEKYGIVWQTNLLISSLLALTAILGDLFQLFLKRGLEIKDFGASLPGHGGLFDRLDSLLAVSIVLAVCVGMTMSSLDPAIYSY